MVRDYDDSLRYTAPGAVGAMVLADAHAHGSPKKRRRLKILAWLILLGFVFTMASTLYGAVFL